MSPAPARSTLITSAPNQASSCVQVGPDCTCVKSRMRTPSSALAIRASRPCLLVHRLVLGARRVLARIDPDVDDSRTLQALHRLARPPQGRGDLCGVVHFLAIPAQHLGELAKGDIAEEVADVAALLAVFGDLPVADLVHRRVIAYDRDIGDAEAVRRLHVEGGHAEGAIAVVAEHFLVGMSETGGDGKTGADAEGAQSTRIHPLSGTARPHRL